MWKYRYSFGMLSSLHIQAYAAAPPSYATVLNLTRMLETTPVWNPPREAYAHEPVERILNRHFARATQQEMLLYLNRPFFAKGEHGCIGLLSALIVYLAIIEHRGDPLKSEYGASVIAAYRSAHQIISLVQDVYAQARQPVSRIWYLWMHVFGAAVCFSFVAMIQVVLMII
jgi:hypothetical protein